MLFTNKLFSLELKDQENQIIDNLRKLCDDRGCEIAPTKTAGLLYQLAKIYRQRSPNKLSLIQSAALFNAAMVRTTDNVVQMQSDLRELCQHVLWLGKAKQTDQNLIEVAQNLFDGVKQMRTHARSQLATSPSRNVYASLNEYEMKKIEFVSNLQNHITADYLKLMRSISNQSILIMGDAPCHFCHAALGSLARKEVTPFSDFESIILLQEGVQQSIAYPNYLDYFRWFTVILQIIILNFGETIIPSVAIPSLNDYITENGDWFFDIYTPRGISFDGLMPHASKTPLGRQQQTNKKPWKTELIKPVSMMLDYLTSESDVKNGYHLADILRSTRLVFGNASVYNEFQFKLDEVGKTKNQNSSIDRILEVISEDLESYAVFDSLATVHKKKNFNVKRMIYRSSTIFISTLGKIHNLRCHSSFDIISELEKKHVITSKAGHNLKLAVAIACEIRLKTYIKNKAQSESLLMYPRKKETTQNQHFDLEGVADINDVIEYFKITFCLQKNIRAGYKESYYDDMRTVDKHVEAVIYFCFFQYQVALEIGKSLRKMHLAAENIEKVAAFTSFIKDCLYHLGRYAEALEETKYELSQELKLKPQNQPNIAKCHQDAAKCLLKLNKQSDAVIEFEKELTVRKNIAKIGQTDESILRNTRDIANTHYSSLNFKTALTWFQLEKQEIEAKKNFSRYCHDLSKCFGNIGGCLFKMNQFEDALENYAQAKNIVSSDVNFLEEVAFYWNKIGHCFFEMSKPEEALASYKNELKVLEQLSGVLTKKDDCFHNIATCVRALNRYPK